MPKQERAPRVLIGPLGLRRALDALASAYGDFIREPGGPLQLLELADGDVWEAEEGGLVICAHETRHTEESIGFRVESETRVLGYTGDTGPFAPLGAFFRGADVLISECAVADGAGADNHLSPASVAQLAAEARPDVLVLTHVYPEVGRYEIVNALRGAGFDGAIEVAGDGLVIELGPDPS
jgi:ribonuclease BN (tRNA processing enzyme)